MNTELQIQLAQQIWNDVEGNTNIVYLYNSREFSKEQNLAIQDLLKRGVIKRNKHSFYVSSQTKFFLENNGKTKFEIKENEEKK